MLKVGNAPCCESGNPRQNGLRFAASAEALGEDEGRGEHAIGQPEMILELEPGDIVLVVVEIGVEPDRDEVLLRPFVGPLNRQRLGAGEDQRIARAQVEALIIADVGRRPRASARASSPSWCIRD